MDYKKIIKNQQLRFFILRILRWIPDSIMLRIQYRMKMGFWPDFKHPKRYTEKLQLYKMKYRNPVMHQCVDKYEVRKYVESKGLGYILNELYGVYDSPYNIDFSKLPDKFVAKTTTGGGGQNVIVVTDKKKCDIEELHRKLALWKGANNLGALAGREWAYQNCKPRIIIEKFLEDQVGGGNLSDYKLLCFDVHMKYIWIDKGRYSNHQRGFWDEELKFHNIYYGYPILDKDMPLPTNIQEMIRVAEKLSENFYHARIDLYNVDGRIIFGEITFYSSSGYRKFEPDEFDFQLGSYFTEYS